MVFFFGLAAGHALYAARFVAKLRELASPKEPEKDVLIAVLHLVASALIASLAMIVALSSYDTLIGRPMSGAKQGSMGCVGRTGYSNLEIKVVTAKVSTPSSHRLRVFFKVENYSGRG